MAITPQTELKLLKVPILINNKNQLTFASKEAQYNYFNGLPKIEEDNFSYQRHNSVIRFPAHIDEILEYNYCMYQNENYSNKWFYAFITNMSYVNDDMTEITITTDVFQTWQFDITWKQSFVEREMINVTDDIIGANRINEGLETGEYVIKKNYSINDLNPYYVIAYVGERINVNATENISTPQRGYKYNGVYSSVCFIVCNDDGFNYLMSLMPNEDNSNNILTIFTVPKLAFHIPSGSTSWSTNGYYVINENMMTNPTYLNNFFDALTTSSDFEGYVPKNKKLLQYPFTYLGFTPLNGNKKIFRYEDFKNFKPNFDIMSEINPNPNVCFVPRNYNRINPNQEFLCTEELCNMSGYPNISYKTDVFNTWLAQNQEILNLSLSQELTSYQQQTANNIMGLAQDSVNAGLNVANSVSNSTKSKNGNGSNGFGIVGEIFNAIANATNRGVNQGFSDKNHELNVQMQMAQVEKQKMLPDTANLSSSATILGYSLINDNIFNTYIIRRQYAERIDKYFDMYGYKTNTLKIPNLNNRPNWNYVKTINANLIGNIPQNDLIAIKTFFDNGITLWHNPATYLDYSQNNR